MKTDGRSAAMDRRSFVRLTAGAAAALAYPSNARSAAAAARPNILHLHVDQMSLLDSISALGAPHVRTPGIDRIVANGTTFLRAFVPDPVCCPSRTTWWTGMYSSEHGVVHNNSPCHADTPDLSRLLQDAGYNTYYAGKWHVPGKDVRKLFHLLHEGGHYAEVTDACVTRSASAFLCGYNDTEHPFFLSVGYLNPHDICFTPQIDANRSQKVGGKIDPPFLREGILDEAAVPPLSGAHGYDKREPEILVAHHRRNIDRPMFSDWSPDFWRIYRHQYHRWCELVDREIQVLLDELEHSKFRDNTLIVFVSDHGEGMGRHHSIQKPRFYEEVVKVPFIIATLGEVLAVRKNIRDDKHLVSSIDFARTVCDFAGADSSKLPPHGLSLRLLAESGGADVWRDVVYGETLFYMHMVCDGRWKYVRGYYEKDETADISFVPPTHTTHPTGVEQLFDLQTDPDEQENLAYAAAHQDKLREMRGVMDAEEDKLLPLRPVPGKGGRATITEDVAAMRKGAYPHTHPVG